jgi:D-aminopeptidase
MKQHVIAIVVAAVVPGALALAAVPDAIGQQAAPASASGGVEKAEKRARAREIGIQVGILPTGKWNAITDVPGVKVGHRTIRQGDSIRTGVTAIVPHSGNLFREKVPAAIYCGNAFGKLAGSTQVAELGTIETPITLTNTLSVAACLEGVIRHTLDQPGNETVRSVNAVVGETNDGYLNDIRGMHVTAKDVMAAIDSAASGPVEEGSVGAGMGTSCFGFKGGIGTASRRLPRDLGGYTVGVLVQSNYSGILTVNGAPVGRELGNFQMSEYTTPPNGDGSCMIVVATDAPLLAHGLERLARRAVLGIGQTGSSMQNGSGDYVIAFSTALRIPEHDRVLDPPAATVASHAMNPLFMAVVEATEEALYNSIFQATSVTGIDGHRRQAIPLDRVVEICRRYGVLNLQERLPGVREEQPASQAAPAVQSGQPRR